MAEGIIRDIVIRPNKIQPVIVNFQNGQLKSDETDAMDCGFFYDEREDKRLLALSNDRVVYKGYKPDPDEDPTYTMLAIRDKRTGKVRLVRAERWQVAPVLDTHVDVDDDDDAADYGDRIANLNKQFGSKRAKRLTEQAERLRVNVESVKDQLEESASRVEIKRAELEPQSTSDQTMAYSDLPECRRDAVNVTEVYDIYDIVPRSKLKSLYDAAAAVRENFAVEGKSKFFVRTLKALTRIGESTREIAVLLYIEAVAAWLNMPIKNAKKRGATVCTHSGEINDHIVESYSMVSAHGRQRPNSMRDKAVIHCIILALSISNFTLDLELFATQLNGRMGLKKLTDLSRIIGAVPIKDNKSVVVLKLPLPPRLIVGGRARKK